MPRDYTEEGIEQRKAERAAPYYCLDIETGYDPVMLDWLLTDPPKLQPPTKSKLQGLGREALDKVAADVDLMASEYTRMDKLAAAILEAIEGGARIPARFRHDHEVEVATWREDKEGEAMKLPWACVVTAVALLPVKPDGEVPPEHVPSMVRAASLEGEAEMLDEAALIMDHSPRVVTFNGAEFDLPILRARMSVLGVSVPDSLKYIEAPWTCHRQVDLRYVLGGQRFAKGRFVDWCKRYGVEPLPPITRLDTLLEWYGAGEWDKVAEHCGKDTNALVGLFKKARQLVPSMRY